MDFEADDGALPWCHLRSAIGDYAPSIVRLIGESYGPTALQQAWGDFTFGRSGPFVMGEPNTELFFSWLFHKWSPRRENGNSIQDEALYGVPPTRAYLDRLSSRQHPIRSRYLEACLQAPFGFYEISDCRPRIGFRARHLLDDADLEVSEGLASTTVTDTDIIFAHIVPIEETALLEAISPISFPPTSKPHITGLRGFGDAPDRVGRAQRELYLRLLASSNHPARPGGRNSDGEA